MQCKQGELAFIKKSLRPRNIGLIVECKGYLGFYLRDDIIEISGERYTAIVSDNYWIISSASGSIETQFGKSKEGFIPDLWLTPIKDSELGDTDTVSKTNDESLTV
jgi:hypothetical protein